MTPAVCLRWAWGLALAALVTALPFGYYRYEYTRNKRLREVDPGILYRSGQMTVPGFVEAVERYHLRTIINLQDEYPDPAVDADFLGTSTVAESELCRRLGVRYVYLPPDLLPRRSAADAPRPKAIDRFREIMDDPANYPVLIHCRAGLHRTGCLTAVYRMEYQGWSRSDALRDLRDNGFGRFASTSDNDYIAEYVLTYQPRENAEVRMQNAE